MRNHAGVVEGGEIGSAQYFQAFAARALPDVRMNPQLLRPENNQRCQVVLKGQVNAAQTLTLELVFDGLADFMERPTGPGVLQSLIHS